MMTTISISKELREELNKLKVHPRETYKDVVGRLIDKEERTEERNENGNENS